MNKNDFSKKAHANAVAKGFWREKMGNEHCLMLVVTEISEMVEADRDGNAQVAININANEVVLCGSRSESTQAASAAPARQSAPRQEERPSDVYRESEVDDLPF
jgi:hypothetical protein